MKNHINIASKSQQLVFIKHFNAVTFKIQLPKLNSKRTFNLILNCVCVYMYITNLIYDSEFIKAWKGIKLSNAISLPEL